MTGRTHCPSCHHRLSPLAMECPVCGLQLARQPLPRPLLFQASALQLPGPPKEARNVAISAPALGRVEPLRVVVPPSEPAAAPREEIQDQPQSQSLEEPRPSFLELPGVSFWPLVEIEAAEALLLLVLNALLLLGMCLFLGAPPGRLYGELWAYLLPLHIALSWALLMVPLVLTGQTLFMGAKGLLLDCDQPERRLSFSIFHLVSVLLFPASFLCMLLSPGHRTLAEILTGQEILERPLPKLK